MNRIHIATLLSVIYCSLTSVSSVKYQIHLLPHTHLDAGWTNTFEGIYQVIGKNIITSLTMALHEDPSLKFNFADLGFLGRWWDDQKDQVKN
jgi:hypothetical protein